MSARGDRSTRNVARAALAHVALQAGRTRVNAAKFSGTSQA
jgi:hypothetical protein